MSYDLQVQANLRLSVVERVATYAAKNAAEYFAQKVCSNYALNTLSENSKIPMPVFGLRADQGLANGGYSSREPVWADIRIDAKEYHDGITLTKQDYYSYNFDKSLNMFSMQAASLPFELAEREVASLLTNGSNASAVCSYSGNTLSFFNAAHLVIPGKTPTFSNNVNAALLATATSALTPSQVLSAVAQGITNIRNRPSADGLIVGRMRPKLIVCSTALERVMLEAVDSAFYGALASASTENAFGMSLKSRYGLEVQASPYIDMALGINQSAVTNKENQFYIICEPEGDAGGIVNGVWMPYSIDNALPAVIGPSTVEAFTIKISGFEGFAYGLPHYITRVF